MRPAITGALPRLAAYGQAMQELKYLCGSGDDYKHRDAVADQVEALEADNVRLRELIEQVACVTDACVGAGFREPRLMCAVCRLKTDALDGDVR